MLSKNPIFIFGEWREGDDFLMAECQHSWKLWQLWQLWQFWRLWHGETKTQLPVHRISRHLSSVVCRPYCLHPTLTTTPPTLALYALAPNDVLPWKGYNCWRERGRRFQSLSIQPYTRMQRAMRRAQCAIPCAKRNTVCKAQYRAYKRDNNDCH